MLGIGNVKVRLRLAAPEDLKFRVAGDAYHLHLAVFLACHAEGVANRILTGPELFGGAFAYDRYIPATIVISFGKRAAAKKIDAHHAEIFGRNNVVAGV